MVKLVSMAANMEGIGKLIAQGSYRLAEHFWRHQLFNECKKT